ncbi:GNAT family N-acetyltransferase [Paenibacillus albidus]|uniref:GNAT family N-acetyltransferase n=1 Tax=Paenibacillus albidus TaxID=2041023 RepID=UPI001BE70FBD|nr:GNAT family N-acetyltransferase [Paenibacillus albidus]MBT2292541.1 GNAT family N-acetyltransferase [Paenibacillus albidus]
MHRFFRFMITDTFRKEGAGECLEDIEQEIAAKEQALQSDLASNGAARTFFIALVQGQLIGTIEYGPASSLINECTNGALQHQVEVGSVFVHPDFQGRGIGSLMWNVVLVALLSHGVEEFCLDSGYAAAQKIWKVKFGEPDYIMQNYWGAGQDHWIWTRQTREMTIQFKA